MLASRITFFIFLLLSLNSFAQRPVLKDRHKNWIDQPQFGIVGGYNNFGFKSVEFGVAIQPWETNVMGGVRHPLAGFTLLQEINPATHFYGTSFNYWYMGGIVAWGLGLVRNSDSRDQTYSIKPMVGICSYNISILYGYNIFLNSPVLGLNHKGVTIKYYIPLMVKKNHNN